MIGDFAFFGTAAIAVIVSVAFVVRRSRGGGTRESELTVDPYRDGFHEKALREASQPAVSGTTDVQFDSMFQKVYAPLIEDSFPSKIVGTAYPNPDGSSRAKLLKKCRPGDQLKLDHEPENPVDSMAVAVRLHETGQQLGYLPARTAHDLLREVQAEPGCNWFGIVHRLNRDPSTGEVVGANIIVAKMVAGEELRRYLDAN